LIRKEFWDALHLRYGWTLLNTPGHCVRGADFTADHAMICRHGGLTFVRHNELRDITAELLSKVCKDVAIEPPLQPLSGEGVVLKPGTERNGTNQGASKVKNLFLNSSQYGAFNCHTVTIIVPELTYKDPRDHLSKVLFNTHCKNVSLNYLSRKTIIQVAKQLL